MTTLFPESSTPVPIAAQVACVEREIGFRVRVYARRVAEGKMAQAKADDELAAMRAVLATLKGIVDARAKFLAADKEAREDARDAAVEQRWADRADQEGVPHGTY